MNLITKFWNHFLFKCIFYPFWWLKYKDSFICNGRLWNCKISVKGLNNSIKIESGAFLNNVSIEINGDNNCLIIGKSTLFSEGGRIRIEDNSNKVIIGNTVAISHLFISVSDNKTSVEIGDNCLISSQVIIRTSDSHSIISKETGQRLNQGANVIIGNHCWIGYGATILKGSCIGADSVVATGAIITGLESPSNSVIAGVPAKVVKTGINWNTKRI